MAGSAWRERRRAKPSALDILFEAEQRGLPVLELLAERIIAGQPAGARSTPRSWSAAWPRTRPGSTS